jgi:excisionase family DNA binding protein
MTNEKQGLGDSLLTAKDAAALLRISSATLLRLARAGQVPAIKVGKLWRFRKSDLDVWLDSQLILLEPSVPRTEENERCVRGNDISKGV